MNAGPSTQRCQKCHIRLNKEETDITTDIAFWCLS